MVSGSHFAFEFPSCSRILSACAEDHRLCLWMNAQYVAEYLMHPSIAASADFAAGGKFVI
jgi:hypothetical protein